MKNLSKILSIITGISLFLTIISFFTDDFISTGPMLILFLILLSISLNTTQKYKGFSFTVLIFAAVSISMYYPKYFVELNGFEMKKLIVPLLQIIMFETNKQIYLIYFRY